MFIEKIWVYGFIAFLFLLFFLLLFYFLRFFTLKTIYNRLKKIRENDIIETNKLLIEKSESDIQLLFQFETALHEIVKLMIKVKNNQEEYSKEVKVLLDYIMKNYKK